MNGKTHQDDELREEYDFSQIRGEQGKYVATYNEGTNLIMTSKNPKYQVFISSTYDDLIEERKQVIMATLEMGHIPVGMEMFSAADEEQWKVITRQIDQSDYYVVIVAQRYGSMVDGISYTEKEYDYALEKGIPALGFVLKDTALWSQDKQEKESRKRKGLEDFKAKVKRKPVSFWSSADDLHSAFATSLSKAFNTNPRPGWVRAPEETKPEVAEELSRLSSENAKLREELMDLRTKNQENEPKPDLWLQVEQKKDRFSRVSIVSLLERPTEIERYESERKSVEYLTRSSSNLLMFNPLLIDANRSCEKHLKNFRKYLHEHDEYQRYMNLCRDFQFSLTNDAQTSAKLVTIEVVLPPDIAFVSEDDIPERPHRPLRPTAHSVSRSAFENITFSQAVASRVNYLPVDRGLYNVAKPFRSRENPQHLIFKVQSLQHQAITVLPPVKLLISEVQIAGTFSYDLAYRIYAENMKAPVDGTLCIQVENEAQQWVELQTDTDD